ncbi:MAG: ATP-binding protein [Candidatus Heimdallarchaeota archaeon]|nr:ATP-binding protein [Candidatus Heimdallarchaeota archaeon]
MSEEKGSDGFVIIAILFVIVLFLSVAVAKVTSILKTIVILLVVIIITGIILLIAIWFIIRNQRKKKFQTNLFIELSPSSNITSIEQKLLLGVIKLTSLPKWGDVTETSTLSELEDSHYKHLQATESFIRKCMNSHLPFGMMLLWQNGSPSFSFWTSAIENHQTNKKLLTTRLEQLFDYLTITFKDLQAQTYLTSNNPANQLIASFEKNEMGFAGTVIAGKHWISIDNPAPVLNDLNLLFQRMKQDPSVTSSMFLTCLPEEQPPILRWFKKWSANRRYRKVTQNMSLGFTDDAAFSNSKRSRNQLSILHQDKASRIALEFEKSKANIINHVGMMSVIAASAEIKMKAQRKAETYLERVKGVLEQIVNPNNEYSYQFFDLTHEEVEKYLEKIFLVDSYLLPNTSECLSQETALLLRLPNIETGLQITREEKSYQPKSTFTQKSNHFLLGFSKDTTTDKDGEGIPIYWDYKNLLKHTFVTGATGGGKTISICQLVKDASDVGIPTILLDFGKGELFTLLYQSAPFLKVFTLGDDSSCPIRINPLECPKWMNPQQHFDNLKSILDASLPQFEPLPIVTYRALSKIFSNDGWNLGEGKMGKVRTLEDLLEAGLKICDEAGYAEEVYQNMRGAWQMRITSLMEGALGRQLFTDRSLPIEELVKGNTILEIRTIESTAQKIITLTILTKLFEYFKSLGPTQQDKPRCLLILDEAESIFASAEVFGNDVEMVTAAYKAVQNLNLILRQGRAYGLAVVIATQSPTNISHEIIANTENKIVHRLHHGKDKQMIQEALELTSMQAAKLSSLKPGECYVVDGENEFPYFMKVKKPNLTKLDLSEQEKKKVMRVHMEEFYKHFPWLKEVYLGSPEKLFDRVFEQAITRVKRQTQLHEETRTRINLVLKREEFQNDIIDLIKNFSEDKKDKTSFYQELLDHLYETAIKVTGEHSEDLKPAALELLQNVLDSCLFINSLIREDILVITQNLVYSGGS